MFNDVVLQLDPSVENCRNSEGAFASLGPKRLIFAYSRFCAGHGGDHDKADIAARFSSDGGRTWTKNDAIIVPNEGGMNVMSVSFLPLKDKALGIFYVRKNGLEDCRPMFRRSYDGGRTWSEAVEVIVTPAYYVLNNDRVIRLKSGRIVLPVSLHRTLLIDKKTKKLDLDYRGIVLFYLSDDDGKTWREAKDWIAPSLSGLVFQEPGVVELADGRILCVIRTNYGQQWTAWSSDGGEHWSAPVPSTIMGPCAPATVKRIPSSSDLLIVWNDHRRTATWEKSKIKPELPPLHPLPGSAGRTPLAAAISHDNGISWGKRFCIESAPDHGFCYIAMHFTDKAILLAYCAGNDKTNNLLCRLRVRRLSYDCLINK
ncbi:MAG: hypothetical protein A2X49_15485 [Lentisphaerae bacterium GWF2_52_8]|nr:MAG: hypothetical protein A2X49_15485 [Lentisphaerae bacterium GWF2_52_8]